LRHEIRIYHLEHLLFFQVLLRGGTTYRDILKEEEARREEDPNIDIEVHVMKRCNYFSTMLT